MRSTVTAGRKRDLSPFGGDFESFFLKSAFMTEKAYRQSGPIRAGVNCREPIGGTAKTPAARDKSMGCPLVPCVASD